MLDVHAILIIIIIIVHHSNIYRYCRVNEKMHELEKQNKTVRHRTNTDACMSAYL